MTPVNMRPVSVVVLAKYREIFEPFIKSFAKFVLPDFTVNKNNLVVVLDKGDIDPVFAAGPFSIILNGPEFFSMAGNGNLGLKAVPTDHDVLYVGDDIRFLKPKVIEKLQEAAYSDEKIGILSPRLIGRGSPTLVNPPDGVSEVRPLEMWFPAVYIKREIFDKIGFLDEDFNNFGSDDLDFCIRVKKAGYKLCVTSKVAVQHEASAEGGPATFVKKLGVETWLQQQEEAKQKLIRKLGVPPSTFDRFLMTGDVSLLEKNHVPVMDFSSMTEAPPREEVEAFLKSRHVHIATPCYGGLMTVNYAQSLINLINLFRDTGINYELSFMYNDSLINRARNRMVAECRRKGVYTDFIFIDADIGFDPKDIVTMLLYDKDVIGAPCVRKNLRLDRVVSAVKKQLSLRVTEMAEAGATYQEIAAAMKNGREYSQDELEIMLGEYVVNWPHNKLPTSMKLDRILEVQDVGTGIMRVKKETFDRFEKFYPERTYLPLVHNSTEERYPMVMFFQSELDEDTKKFNPGGYADYVSEDFSFCRACRKAGMSIWITPWLKTTHAGTYVFKGDLMAVSATGAGLR